MQYINMFLLILMLTACGTSIVPVTLSPLPDFIYSLDFYGDIAEEYILCFWITQKPLIEDYTDVVELEDQILQSIHIEIDSQPILQQDIEIRSDAILYPLLDENQEIVSTYGGNLQFCIANTGFEIGVHDLYIKITNLHNREFVYQTQIMYDPS